MSRDEFASAVRVMGYRMTNEECRHVFDFFDTDDNGTVNYEEFLLHLRVSDHSLFSPPLPPFPSAPFPFHFVCPCNPSVLFQPPMSKARLSLIEKAFAKLDKTGDGKVTVEDLRSEYDVSQHPKFKSGEMTKKQVRTQHK